MFPQTIVLKVTKILDPNITIQLNLHNKQEIQISAKHALQNAHSLNSTTSLNGQINLSKSPMIWKDCLKLSEVASYSKLAWVSKASPPPLPPGGIGLRLGSFF